MVDRVLKRKRTIGSDAVRPVRGGILEKTAHDLSPRSGVPDAIVEDGALAAGSENEHGEHGERTAPSAVSL